jgi:outer membrane protein TolC
MVKLDFMRKVFGALAFVVGMLPIKLRAQERLLHDSAIAEASRHYPALRDKQWIQKQEQLAVANLKTIWLPQVQLNAQASYQSDVTRVPLSLPGFSLEAPAQDQYRAVADISQLLYDGGVSKKQVLLRQQEAISAELTVEVELQQLRERISQYFLTVVLLDGQARQARLVRKDIETGMQKMQAQVEQGLVLRSNYDVLKAEWLKADQRLMELESSRGALVDILSLYMGRTLDTSTIFIAQAPEAISAIEVARPELKLFQQQRQLSQSQEQLLQARRLPKLHLFAQGGYGRPGLNMLKNDFEFYYVGGIRLQWSLQHFYTLRRDRKQQETLRRRIDVQEDIFRQTTSARLMQEEAAIAKMEKLMERDKEIVALRESITKAAAAQLESGVITANDYLREINAEDQARQALLLHELQWLQARINYKIISGKK